MVLTAEALFQTDLVESPRGVVARLTFGEGMPGGGLRSMAKCGDEFCVARGGPGCQFFRGVSKSVGDRLFEVVCIR